MSALDAANRRLNAIIAWAPRHEANIGPLTGHTVAVKANIDIAGMATTAGLAHCRGHVATADAPLVAALRAAGATILGHANMDEAALGASTENPHWGTTENPRRRGHGAGGSSGGSAAAVAGGLATLALGTDTLGSVRIPASHTGIFGLRSATLPMAGIVPLAPRFDTAGLFAATLQDLALCWQTLTSQMSTVPIRRLALLADIQAAPMAQAVRAAWDAMVIAARAQGLTIHQRPLTGLSLPAARLGAYREALLALRDQLGDAPVSPRLARWLSSARDLPDGTAAIARAHDSVHEALAHADAVLIPTAPRPAPRHGQRHDDMADFCALASIAGLPALSLPAGLDMDGLPLGVQLVAPLGHEAALIALAGQLTTRRRET